MLFNSYEFIFVFLPLVLSIYFFLNKYRLIVAGKAFLVFSSLFFYSWWNPNYLPIILSSMLFNYAVGSSLLKSNNIKKNHNYFSRRNVLYFGIGCNLSLLAYFKYMDFFIMNVNFLFNSSWQPLGLLLPLAISFFTFQQIAYLVDSYNNKMTEYDFLNYSLFVTFFPQLIAGPIVHHSEMMPQFYNRRNLIKKYENIMLGTFIFSIGLFKKVVIADNLSYWAGNGFDIATTLNLVEAWCTSLSYTFQLYFDFSGYSDMAIGVALLFNIRLPRNFNSPYKASNIQDFWRRWHITLSRFLRDYIYIPLGGNRKGKLRLYSNLFLTFFIGGLWHGAGWNFLIWGALHGFALIFYHLWNRLNFSLPKLVSWLITFNFINITWVFFRAKNWNDATKVLSSMFDFNNVVLPQQLYAKLQFLDGLGVIFSYGWFSDIGGKSVTFFPLLLIAVILLTRKNSEQIIFDNVMSKRKAIYFALIFSISILYLNKLSEFLYFNF